MTPTILFDIESTGLLRQGSQIHCIVTRDMSNPKDHSVYDHRESQTVAMGVQALTEAGVLVGHNIIGYDIPLLKEQFPDFEFKGELMDTLVLSRLFYPHIMDRDYERRPAGMPQKLYGRHSLEAWGHRLKCYKGGYDGGWARYTPEMLDYCVQDTLVTVKLFQLMQRRMADYE
jgi:DNA polymerase-1